jgi:hypothetical protein
MCASQKPFDGIPYTRLAAGRSGRKSYGPAICSFQGAVLINRPALCRLPLWPIEAPSIAPSFHEPFAGNGLGSAIGRSLLSTEAVMRVRPMRPKKTMYRAEHRIEASKGIKENSVHKQTRLPGFDCYVALSGCASVHDSYKSSPWRESNIARCQPARRPRG